MKAASASAAFADQAMTNLSHYKMYVAIAT